MKSSVPEILSPAGDKESFFAAISAGANAVYVGLKEFSARAKATNFEIKELITLREFANSKGVKLYIALNSLIREDELSKVLGYLILLQRYVKPDALILQDPGLLNIINKDFDFEIHISTLANVSLGSSFGTLSKLGVTRVVLPRELTIDEIKYLSQCCGNIGLEVFVHGALCYGVSGRCYWSGMMGGKMGLRGECVQPCRRTYRFKDTKEKYFSCRDLGLDVLIKVLLKIPQVVSFKIEGRKKGPHYVYYVTKAYKVLRDNPNDTKAKKLAMDLLDMSLGRPTTHYFFLTHRKYNPIELDRESASGLKIGTTSKSRSRVYIRPKIDLLPGDRLRISYEKTRGHNLVRVNTFVKKGKKFYLNRSDIAKPVFLIDRRESDLVREINRLKGEWSNFSKGSVRHKVRENKLGPMKLISYPKNKRSNYPTTHLVINTSSSFMRRDRARSFGLWIYNPNIDPVSLSRNTWIFLDPVIWPEDEKKWKNQIDKLVSMGFKFFILNSLHHVGLVSLNSIHAWLGPFANITNSEGVYLAANMGFKGVVVSPEVKELNMLQEIVKHSPLPLGVFIKGLWPYTISRTKHQNIPLKKYIYSPRKEPMWLDKFYRNYYLFPKKEISLIPKLDQLKQLGFKLFLEFSINML